MYVCIMYVHNVCMYIIHVLYKCSIVLNVGSALHSCYPLSVDPLVLCDGVSEWRRPDVPYSISKKIPPQKSHVSDNT